MSQPEIHVQIDFTKKFREFCETTEFKQACQSATATTKQSNINIDVDVTGKMRDFSRTSEFERIVKDIHNKIVSEHSFWSNFLQQMQIQAIIKTETSAIIPTSVRNEIQNTLPNILTREIQNRLSQAIRDELMKTVPGTVLTETKNAIPDIANRYINDYVSNNLPAHVYEQLDKQFINYINNNQSMQRILHDHMNQLNISLQNTTTQILTELVSNPAYHEVTTLHLKALDIQFMDRMNYLDNLTLQQQNKHDTTFNMTIKNCIETFQNSFTDLEKKVTDGIAITEQFNQRLTNIETTMKQNVSDLSSLQKYNKAVSIKLEEYNSQITGLESKISFYSQVCKWTAIGLVTVSIIGAYFVFGTPRNVTQMISQVPKIIVTAK